VRHVLEQEHGLAVVVADLGDVAVRDTHPEPVGACCPIALGLGAVEPVELGEVLGVRERRRELGDHRGRQVALTLERQYEQRAHQTDALADEAGLDAVDRDVVPGPAQQ
jgi:hypothetical protein